MSKSATLIIGIITTIAIFGLSKIGLGFIKIESEFIPPMAISHTIMLGLSIFLISFLKKKELIAFPFKKVKPKYYMYAILIAILSIIVSNIIATIIVKAFGYSIDPSGKGHALVANFSPLQFFLFVFLYASICEEFLFRGFAQNFLGPLTQNGFRVNKDIFISIPVIVSGILFGMAHLTLLTTETSGPMILRIVIFTTFLGLTAGYFQEKHKNILIAILVHMIGNLPGLIMSFLS